MAWAQLKNLGGLQDIAYIATDYVDSIFYALGGDDTIRKYGITGNDIVIVCNSASIDGGVLAAAFDNWSAITWFKGGLYCIVRAGDTHQLSVWKWDGVGTNWTLVKILSAVSGTYGSITSDNDQIVAVGVHLDDPSIYYVEYSSDGSSWDTGTLSLSPAPYAGTYNNAWFRLNKGTIPSGIWGYWRQNLEAPNTNDAYYILEWTGTGFITSKYYRFENGGPTESGDEWVYDEFLWSGNGRHWRDASGLARIGLFEHSDNDLDDWTAAATADPVPSTYGFPSLSIGFDPSNGNGYTLEDTTWDLLEEIWVGAGSMQGIIRLSSNFFPYAIVQIGVISYIYGRGSAMADPADDSGNRLWVYKIAADGTISSRGVVAT